MLRLICFLCLLSGPAAAADSPLVREAGFAFAGPDRANGALVWIHGTYGRDETGPPPPPDFVAREAGLGFDIWGFHRERRDDPLDRGASLLARGVAELRQDHYRRIFVAGHSRGAWIALTILAHPGLADGVVAFSPAAHGTRDDARPRALGDWRALWAAAVDDGTPVVLAQMRDDPWDPGPEQRLAVARARFGDHLLSIFQPDSPTGHAAVYEPAFDERFGSQISSFLHGR